MHVGPLPLRLVQRFSELRLALRVLLKSRRFTLAVILTLAIGIASNTLIFSVAESVFWRPMPYPDSSRLMYVSQALSYRPGYPEARELLAKLESDRR